MNTLTTSANGTSKPMIPEMFALMLAWWTVELLTAMDIQFKEIHTLLVTTVTLITVGNSGFMTRITN